MRTTHYFLENQQNKKEVLKILSKIFFCYLNTFSAWYYSWIIQIENSIFGRQMEVVESKSIVIVNEVLRES